MFRKLLSSVLIVILVLTGFLPPRLTYAQENKFYTIAVLDLVANGISESETRSLSDVLRGQIIQSSTAAEFKKKSGYVYKVIERSQMEKILEEMNFQRSGCTDEECAVEVGKQLGAERMVIGSVGLVGETYTLNTRIVDVETASTLSAANYLFTGKRDNLLITGIPIVVNNLLYGSKQKKSKKLYYIIGGIVLAGGAAVAVMGGGSDGGGDGNGTMFINIVLDE